MYKNTITIHTLKFSFNLNKDQYINILKNECKRSKELNINIEHNRSKGKKIFTEDGLPADQYTEYHKFKTYLYEGVTIETSCFKRECMGNTTYIKSTLYLRINPRIFVLGLNDLPYVGLFDLSLTDNLLWNLSHLLGEISNSTLSLSNAVMNRLDYSINYDLIWRNLADEFMYLLTQANIPKGFELKIDKPRNKNKEYIPYNHIKIENKSYAVSIYAKASQMENQSKKITYPDMDESQGVIRFEIQTKYRKAYNIKKKYNIQDIGTLIKRSFEHGYEIFTQILPRMYGHGDFVRYEEAINKIFDSTFEKTIKNRMIKLVKLTCIYQSFDKALKQLKTEITPRESYYLLKKFDDLRISPITISQYSNYDIFPNPMALINENQNFIWDGSDKPFNLGQLYYRNANEIYLELLNIHTKTVGAEEDYDKKIYNDLVAIIDKYPGVKTSALFAPDPTVISKLLFLGKLNPSLFNGIIGKEQIDYLYNLCRNGC